MASQKELPMFFGLNHQPRSVEQMIEKLERFTVSGVRCFLECTPQTLSNIRKFGVVVSHPEWTTFAHLIQWLDKRGVEIVPLDSRRVTRLVDNYRSAITFGQKKPDPKVAYFLNHMLRERGWGIQIRLQATPKDIVVAHPNHMITLIGRMNVPNKRVKWIDKPEVTLDGSVPMGVPLEGKLLEAERRIEEQMRRRRTRPEPSTQKAKPQRNRPKRK